MLSLVLGTTALAAPPAPTEYAATARWMVSDMTWGYMSTISTRTNASTPGDAFGNPYSFADASNGVPYFYVSDLDASIVDMFSGPGAKPRASLALSEATLRMVNGSAQIAACEIGTPLGDPENPPCARLVLSGTMVKLAADSAEGKTAHDALFARHPSFKHYPKDHAFYCTKLEVDGVWLIDAYGGAAIVSPSDYFAASIPPAVAAPTPAAAPLAVAKELVEEAKEVVAAPKVGAAPWIWEHPKYARWMASMLNWGVLSTVSTRSKVRPLPLPAVSSHASRA